MFHRIKKKFFKKMLVILNEGPLIIVKQYLNVLRVQTEKMIVFGPYLKQVMTCQLLSESFIGLCYKLARSNLSHYFNICYCFYECLFRSFFFVLFFFYPIFHIVILHFTMT